MTLGKNRFLCSTVLPVLLGVAPVDKLIGALTLLTISGCALVQEPTRSASGSSAFDTPDGNAQTASESILADSEDSAQPSAVEPIPVALAGGANFTTFATDPTFLDPFHFSEDAFINSSFFLSLLLDDVLLGLLDPSGPSLEMSFLERLCREGDDPDFVCRDRYGQ